ncbi:MAG: DUF433 domain-containing protein [Blastocatellales bacterium]|nr:DUF433 domain-containing protein [Blastocatellales bacterium]
MPTLASTMIEIDEQGTAWVRGTQVKVIEVALDKVAHGWSPEEIHFQHPHLSLAQIHGALAYYYEHKTEFDEQMILDVKQSDAWARQAQDSPVRQRLRKMGDLP